MIFSFNSKLPKQNLIPAIVMLLALETVCAQDSSVKTKMPQSLYGFTQPAPMDFNDHEGYVSLFDGKGAKDFTLKFEIKIESITKVSVRNIWIKKLD